VLISGLSPNPAARGLVAFFNLTHEPADANVTDALGDAEMPSSSVGKPDHGLDGCFPLLVDVALHHTQVLNRTPTVGRTPLRSATP
jgi:hypothetical protein